MHNLNDRERSSAKAYLDGRAGRELARVAIKAAEVAITTAEHVVTAGRAMYLKGTKLLLEADDTKWQPGILMKDLNARIDTMKREGRRLRRDGMRMQGDGKKALRVAIQAAREARHRLELAEGQVHAAGAQEKPDHGLGGLLDWDAK